MANINVPEPFPISMVADRYLLYDINSITYARREHRILGVLIGSLPQAPQQNVFTGLPLELMPEEARLLVEEGHAYIVNDVQIHKNGLRGLSRAEEASFRMVLERQGLDAAKKAQAKADARSEQALANLRQKTIVKGAKAASASRDAEPVGQTESDTEEDDGSVFTPSSPRSNSVAASRKAESELSAFGVTPTTSFPPLSLPSTPPDAPLPNVPRSYPLFAHLHQHGYYLSPGLRFGCQYVAYPGDSLRYHSHFLASGLDWNQEFDLLTLVGGGRLGTGVKKAYLLGGREGSPQDAGSDGMGNDDRVRTFCIEWGGM